MASYKILNHNFTTGEQLYNALRQSINEGPPDKIINHDGFWYVTYYEEPKYVTIDMSLIPNSISVDKGIPHNTNINEVGKLFETFGSIFLIRKYKNSFIISFDDPFSAINAVESAKMNPIYVVNYYLTNNQMIENSVVISPDLDLDLDYVKDIASSFGTILDVGYFNNYWRIVFYSKENATDFDWEMYSHDVFPIFIKDNNYDEMDIKNFALTYGDVRSIRRVGQYWIMSFDNDDQRFKSYFQPNHIGK